MKNIREITRRGFIIRVAQGVIDEFGSLDGDVT